METLETERLIVRPFAERDLCDFFEYASVPGVGEAAGWKHHLNLSETKKILKMFSEDPLENAVVLKKENKLVGSIGLQSASRISSDFPGRRVWEIGYVLSPFYEKHGYMTEAVKAVISCVFNKDLTDILAVSHFEGNEKSKGVILRCGFVYYRLVKNVYFAPIDANRDLWVYLLTKQDWAEKNPAAVSHGGMV